MTMIFRKERMLARLEKEGRLKDVDEESLKIMNDLDGKPATPACWARQVYGEPVLWCEGDNGTSAYVNEKDCTL